MISDEELLQFYRCGFIPGPDENEEKFLNRIQKTKELSQGKERIPLDAAVKTVERLFSMCPHDFLATYGNENLSFWEGGAAFFYDDIPVLQIKKNGWFARFYPRDEILAHELVHAARSSFNEPRYEEFFAYMTSQKQFRRSLGPLFSRSFEPWILLAGFLPSFFFFSPLPVILIMAGFCLRLFWRRRILNRCLKSLKTFTEHTLPVALCLTDSEIAFFASHPQEKTKEFIEKNKNSSLRWRLVNVIFLKR